MIPSCKNVWWRGIRPYASPRSSTHECSSCCIGLNSQYIASDGSKLLQLVVGGHTQSLASIPLGKCCIRFQSLSNCSLDQPVKLYDLCLQKSRGVSWSWVTLLQTLVKAAHKKNLIIMLLKPSYGVLGCRFLLASLQIRSFRFWEGCPRQRLLPGLKWRSWFEGPSANYFFIDWNWELYQKISERCPVLSIQVCMITSLEIGPKWAITYVAFITRSIFFHGCSG